MIYIGIDPGKDGGFSALDDNGRIVSMMKTPIIGKEYDVRSIVQFLSQFTNDQLHVGIENVHAIQNAGRTSNFTFGKGLGILIGVVEGMGLPYTMVTPQTWQKNAWSGVPVLKKGNSKDTKGMSLVASRRLFPDYDFTASARATKPHDGMIDATLIAYHLKCENR